MKRLYVPAVFLIIGPLQLSSSVFFSLSLPLSFLLSLTFQKCLHVLCAPQLELLSGINTVGMYCRRKVLLRPCVPSRLGTLPPQHPPRPRRWAGRSRKACELFTEAPLFCPLLLSTDVGVSIQRKDCQRRSTRKNLFKESTGSKKSDQVL